MCAVLRLNHEVSVCLLLTVMATNEHHIILDSDTLDRWRGLSTSEGLASDGDAARYLLNL